MARQLKRIGFVNTLAVIVDGKDEKWYLEKVKKHYQCDKLREIRIEPNLPQEKGVKDLFELAKEKVEQNYGMVMLFLDFDDIMASKDEMRIFKDLYSKWLEATANPTRRSKYSWMAKMRVIVNNPCLEYWYLLHFKKTTKFYERYEPHLKQELRKQPGMQQYEKKEDYYNRLPDIYQRLTEHGSLEAARKNAEDFDLNTYMQRGTSEIFKLFDYFDNEL